MSIAKCQLPISGWRRRIAADRTGQRRSIGNWKLKIGNVGVALSFLVGSAHAQPTNTAIPIDLPTALRLAGAQNLDVQIARERVAEARANHRSAITQFFPWVAPGITYRQHDDKIQDVAGNILDVNKYSYAPGAIVGVQLELGDAIYKALAAKQLARAADYALEAQRQDSVLAAAQGYFQLALARGAVGVARDAVRIASSYEDQLDAAVTAGVAFKGDLLRARVQAERNRVSLRQAEEQQRFLAARLAQTLRLDSTVELWPADEGLAMLSLIESNAALAAVVSQALGGRSELRQSQSLVAAAREAKDGTAFGPLIPTLGAQAFWGGLGGGRDGVADRFGGQQDFLVGVSWKVGPSGLFDAGRVRAAESRWKIATLAGEKLRDDITRQAVEAFARWRSLGDQVAITERALRAAEESLRLAQQRKEFAVGVVLETLQAEQDLTRARLEFLRSVADFNAAQYALNRVRGRL